MQGDDKIRELLVSEPNEVTGRTRPDLVGRTIARAQRHIATQDIVVLVVARMWRLLATLLAPLFATGLEMSADRQRTNTAEAKTRRHRRT
jgi:hypothetical protein